MVRTFFVVFVLTVGMVLMNIVIAILLDEFLGTVTREKAEARKRQLKKQTAQLYNVRRLDSTSLASGGC